MTKTIVLRFLRAALASGIASVAALLALGVSIKDFQELKALGFALGIAFISGAIQAIDKALRFNEETNM